MSAVIHSFTDLGPCDYRQVWRLQHALHVYCRATRKNGLILTQHTPVVTLGYRRPTTQLRLSVAELTGKGIALIEVERGGGATYHGPGQLVAYPIFSSLLRRQGVRNFVVCLEEVMCRVSQRCGVVGTRKPGLPGVWVGESKLGSVGIAVRGGVSLHGCAVNVNGDLQPFSYIIPCGLTDKTVTSLEQERGRPIPLSVVAEQMRHAFAEVFTATMEEMPNEWSCFERETGTGALDYDQSSRATQCP
jgi:lipoate-protein ligase B